MEAQAVYVRNNRIVGCQRLINRQPVFVSCVKCLKADCPVAQAEVREFATFGQPTTHRKAGS